MPKKIDDMCKFLNGVSLNDKKILRTSTVNDLWKKYLEERDITPKEGDKSKFKTVLDEILEKLYQKKESNESGAESNEEYPKIDQNHKKRKRIAIISSDEEDKENDEDINVKKEDSSYYSDSDDEPLKPKKKKIVSLSPSVKDEESACTNPLLVPKNEECHSTDDSDVHEEIKNLKKFIASEISSSDKSDEENGCEESDEQQISSDKSSKKNKNKAQLKDTNKLTKTAKEKQKKRPSSNKSSSESDDDDNEGSDSQDETNDKKDSGKENQSRKSSNTDVRLKKYYRYLHLAGLFIPHKELQKLKSHKSKVQLLLKTLQDAGLKGSPTLKTCKKLKKKRDRDKEIAELDLGNIIESSGGRSRRNVSSLYMSAEQKSFTDVKASTKLKKEFSGLRGIIDSEESD